MKDFPITPPKTNMEPEHTSWKRRNINPNHEFFGFYVEFRGMYDGVTFIFALLHPPIGVVYSTTSPISPVASLRQAQQSLNEMMQQVTCEPFCCFLCVLFKKDADRRWRKNRRFFVFVWEKKPSHIVNKKQGFGFFLSHLGADYYLGQLLKRITKTPWQITFWKPMTCSPAWVTGWVVRC